MSQGEGSRGGRIIRHTKSGLPVYASQEREKHETRDKLVKSGAFVGGGVGVGIYGGWKAGSVANEASKLGKKAKAFKNAGIRASKRARELGPLFGSSPKLAGFFKKADTLSKESERLAKVGFGIKSGASFLAGTLIGIGINEAIKDRPEFKENKKAQAVAVAAPTILGGIAAGAGFAKKTGKAKTWSKAAKFALKNLLVFK